MTNITNFFNGFRLVRLSLLRWAVILKDEYNYHRCEQFWLSLQGEEFDWQQYIEATINEVLRNQILDFQKVVRTSGVEVKPYSIFDQGCWKENNPRGMCWDAEKEVWTIQELSPPKILELSTIRTNGLSVMEKSVQEWKLHSNIILYAFDYCLGRQTYAGEEFIKNVKANQSSLNPFMVDYMVRSIKSYLQRQKFDSSSFAGYDVGVHWRKFLSWLEELDVQETDQL